MKTSTKILLAGLVPVFLFIVASICVNRARAERIIPEVEKLSAALDLATVRVVDLRGTFAPEEMEELKSADWAWGNQMAIIRGRNVSFRTRVIPSSDWIRRDGDMLIVDRSAVGSLQIELPQLEELKVSGTTIRTWESPKEEDAPQDAQ